MVKEDDVLAKAFCTMDIMIRPGARKVKKVTLPMVGALRPMDRANTAKNSKVVIMGEIRVCR